MLSRVLAIVTLVVAAVAGCGKASSPTNPSPMPSPSPSGSTVSIVVGAATKTTGAYSPNPITVARGGSVMWVNNDATAHTSTSDNNTWNSGTIAPGANFSHTFASSGTFTYHCMIHPGMVGTVTVQ